MENSKILLGVKSQLDYIVNNEFDEDLRDAWLFYLENYRKTEEEYVKEYINEQIISQFNNDLYNKINLLYIKAYRTVNYFVPSEKIYKKKAINIRNGDSIVVKGSAYVVHHIGDCLQRHGKLLSFCVISEVTDKKLNEIFPGNMEVEVYNEQIPNINPCEKMLYCINSDLQYY